MSPKDPRFMNRWDEYPLSVVAEACQSIFGWTAAVCVMSLCGCVLGYWMARGHVTTLVEARGVLVWLPLIWIVIPEVLLGFVATFVTWYLGVHFGSAKGLVAAACVPFVVWVAVIWLMVVRFGLA